MWRLMQDEKAQAAVELAIIASIMILAFSSLISFTEKINRTQKHMQDVFRKQLIAAHGTGYSSSKDAEFYRAPNIIAPYEPGELVFLSNSKGRVRWNSHGTGSNADVGKVNNSQWQNIDYTNTLTHKEVPGGLLDARHVVRYIHPITGKVVTRGEYE